MTQTKNNWIDFCEGLKAFWSDLKDCPTKDDRISLVIRWSHLKMDNRRSYEQRRFKTHGRYSRKLCQICREKRGIVHHHIITIKNGGYDTGNNRIQSCPECHEKIHPWMRYKEIDKQSSDMDAEFNAITNFRGVGKMMKEIAI